MKTPLLLIFGISLLVGLLGGYITSEKKYFLLSPIESKREITFENYRMYFDKSNYEVSRYAKFTKVQDVYNIKNAILFGLTTLGVLSVVFSFLPFKNNMIGRSKIYDK